MNYSCKNIITKAAGTTAFYVLKEASANLTAYIACSKVPFKMNKLYTAFTVVVALTMLLTASIYAQRRRANNPNDTLTSNYNPQELFSPAFYTEKGNEFHSANGAPGPKYWQNKADYQLNAKIDTANKTLSATENITYTNNSPDALPYLWLQLDQNTYLKEARSNFVTGRAATAHTKGYQFESVEIVVNGKPQTVNYIVNDTRMQIRLPKALAANGGKINVLIKYHYEIPGDFGGRTDFSQTKNG